MLLATMKHTKDGDGVSIGIDPIGDHGASAVVRHTQARANIVARHTRERKHLQALTSIDHCIHVAPGDRSRGFFSDV